MPTPTRTRSDSVTQLLCAFFLRTIQVVWCSLRINYPYFCEKLPSLLVHELGGNLHKLLFMEVLDEASSR
jgi:hypothetical protein